MSRGVQGNAGSRDCVTLVELGDAFEAYDALPGPLRTLLQLAPFDCDPLEMRDMLAQVPLDRLCRMTIGAMSDSIRISAKDWGRGYPVASCYRPVLARGGGPVRSRYRRARLIL